MNKEYVENLEKVIKQMMEPLKGIPFNLVVEGLSKGHKIIPFDSKNKDDIAVLKVLKKVAVLAGKKINEEGIVSRRPNEVGNKIESFIKNALKESGYEADIPKAANEKKKSAGYPDILFYDKKKRKHYLECKTYSTDTLNISMRSFFVSPSKNSKIIYDAHHFLISFEMYEDTKTIFKTRSYKIISLENLLVDIKYEFNANNIALYKDILASGKIEV